MFLGAVDVTIYKYLWAWWDFPFFMVLCYWCWVSRRREEKESFRETEGKLENPVGVCSRKSQRNK